METLQIDEGGGGAAEVATKTGFFVTKKIALLIGLLTAVVFTGSILATYFGKSCPESKCIDIDAELYERCRNAVCSNNTLINSWQSTCPTTQNPITTTTTTTPPTTTRDPEKINFRLPTDLTPFRYDLTIKPYIGRNPAWTADKDFTFEGYILMHFTCSNPTQKIVFHSYNLNLNRNSMALGSNGDNGISIDNNNVEIDLIRDFVTVSMNRACLKDVDYSLKINFTGEILNSLFGFYRSSYIDENGIRQNLATTKFQPTYPRRAFPCFDEPAMKAAFRFTLIRHNSFSTPFFNTPLVGSTLNGEWWTDSFIDTPKMSTYLLAYVIANFKSINGQSPRGNSVEIAARPQAIDNNEGKYALNESIIIVDFFEEYFDVDYPLDKITHIAIPDFNSGAMENWGLITYRETSLLYDPNRDTIANKRRVSVVVSHELAHQWFGNLVTLKWWNDLWLNEGFASWVEYLGYNATHPEWRDLEYFFVQNLGPFVQDSLETSHPISVEVNDPNEITSLFDSISYSKGASIIRMMNAFLTEKTFRKGVSNYLKYYQNSNAEQDDLWAFLTAAAREDGTLIDTVSVKDIMDTWTLRKGYPVVTVARTGNQIRLTQKWFLLNPLNTIQNTPEYNEYKWYIPFTFTTKDELNYDFETAPRWFMPEQPQLTINLPANTNANSWVIGNLQHSGWYRINYDENNWKLLIDQLNTDHLLIDPVHRAQLLDDSFNLGRAEIIDQLVFLNINKYLVNEIDPLPFRPALNGLNTITPLIEDDFESFEIYKIFYINLLRETYARLEWRLNLEDANEITLQTSTLQAMCSFGFSDCIKQARIYYNDWINEDIPLPVNFKSIIYSTIAQHGNKNEWLNLFEIAVNRTDYTERLRIFGSLASSKDLNLVKFLLSKLDDTNFVRLQDKSSLLGSIASNSVGRKLAYDYLEENWEQLLADFGEVSFTLPNIVTSCTSRLNRLNDLNRLENFIKANEGNLGVAAAAFTIAVENVKTNIRWIEKNLDDVKVWLSENSELDPPRPVNYRLSGDLSPLHYDLTIQPYFKRSTRPEYYNGKVKIDFTCKKDTSKLVLHAKDLEVNDSTLVLSSESDTSFMTMTAFPWTYDPVTQFLVVDLKNQMFKATFDYTFSVEFKGFPKDDDLGFYRTSYIDEKNQRIWLMLSQLEYIEARRSFPSFDEPGFKSTFSITIVHDSSLIATSNMPVESNRSIGMSEGYDWIETKFEKSFLMPTYLIAILISDYKCMDGIANTPGFKAVDVSVCARPNAYDQLDLAFNSSIEILEFFENYYKVGYPLPKLDHVASPTFKYGAMENWGLAVYLENNFLLNENSTQQTEQNIVRIIAHEISHMWFGDLVTPKWWDDLWLNEGFARFAEHLGADGYRPTWRMFDRLYDLLLNVIQLDSSDTTRPVSVDVNTPDEINDNINPTITYGKGGAVVKMLEYVLGVDTFRNGLKSYFEKFAYKNVDQFDLWESLQEIARNESKLEDDDLSKIMTTWTKQKGHPVLTIKRINSRQISVRQNRFVLDTNFDISEDNIKWYIPFSHSVETVGSSSSITNEVDSTNLWDKIAFLDPSDKEILLTPMDELSQDKFLIVNLDMAGFYRVNYDEEDWKLISKQLFNNRDQLSLRSRATLVSDVLSLSEANYINPGIAFNLIKYLSNEFDFLPWNVFISRIKFFTDLFDLTPSWGQMQLFLSTLVQPYYNKLGWIENSQTDSYTDRLYRPNIVRFACLRDVPDCVSKSRGYFAEWKSSGDISRIPRGYRAIVSCTVVRNGDQSDFDWIFNQTKIITDAAARNDLLSGLSCSKEQGLLTKYLDDQLATSNILTALNNVGSKPFGSSLAISFLKRNWNEIYSKYSTSAAFPTLIRDITLSFKYLEQYNDLVSFLSEKQLTRALQAAFNEARIKIRSNIKWFAQNSKSVSDWLDSYDYDLKPEINFRLPMNLKPLHYDLTIKPYIGRNPDWEPAKDFTFEGTIIINYVCQMPTRRIIFHGVDIDIDTKELELESSEDKDIKVNPNFQLDALREFVIMETNKECLKDAIYKLKISYIGQIGRNLFGFYRSSYLDENGIRQDLATTQFQPTDARRAFPCFDEPAFKASFNYTLTRHNSFKSSFFNTPKLSTIDGAIWSTDTFKETPKMSTYLVAFVISNFEQINETSSKGNMIEVAARPEAINNGDGLFALNESSLIIDFFEEYFEVEYPLDKSTQIAVPDFSAGAMENWGLVIYREADLLYNPNRDLISNKRRVSLVISHELAHQWFGNLVTPVWWNDLWLNEGFASWVEYLGYNYTHPEWRDLEYFFVQNLNTFVLDSLESSHPVSVEVNDPNEINSLFDSITYDKGASIIRMMNAFLTEDSFRKGVSNYLGNFSYANAEQDDLWEFLTAAAREDESLDPDLTVKDVMDTWTLQKGYPLVTVTRKNNKIHLTQRYFLLNPLNTIENTPEYAKYQWFVPFTFTTQNELNYDFEERPTWLKPSQTEVTIDLPQDTNADSWVIGNLEHAGWYRVNYDAENWALLINQLYTDYKVLSPVHRAQILDDTLNLGRAEIVDQLVFLDVTKYLINENDPLPFIPGFSGLNFIRPFVDNQFETFELFKQYYKNLITGVYDKLGWSETLEDANEINLQISVLQIMCNYGNQDCIEKSRAYYNDWINNDIALPVNFKTVVYSSIAINGNEQDWFKLYEIATTRNDYAERLRILRGLATTRNYNLLKFLLDKFSDTTIVRLGDKSSLIGSVAAANSVGRRLAYDYLEENWNQLFADYGAASFTLPSLVNSVTNRLNQRNDLNRVENFIKANEGNLGVATEAFASAVENIKTNIRWSDKNLKAVSNWLSENVNIKPTPLNYRLSADLMPNHYDLTIKPYFKVTQKPEHYDGSVKIAFTCTKDTSKLVVHAKDLKINDTTLRIESDSDSNFIPLVGLKYMHDPITHFLTVNILPHMFKANEKYTFSAEFVGYTKSDDLGFYRTSYEQNGVEKWLVTSQLEYIEARKSFISFDEPGFKSTFAVTIVHDATLTARSNMPIKQNRSLGQSDGYDWIETTFDTTVPMSTYLLAILISDYECLSGISDTPISGGTDVSVCTRPNAVQQLDLAFNASLDLLKFFEEYYQVEYPLPKLDHVSSPTFKYGAMENWGLAVYLETVFLFNETSTQSTEQSVVSVISHEISHMWFGNLVTPKWWDDLWLNEGFARFAEHLGPEVVRPSWRMFDRLYDLLLNVIYLDSSDTTRPVSIDVNTPDEINDNINPTITYGKGAAVVKMLEYVLGSDTFRNGLEFYFKKFQFKNVDQFDLWNSLEEVAKNESKWDNQDLSEIMTTWTKQKGHPVLEIKRISSNQISVKQKRFVFDTNLDVSDDNIRWYIPFSHSVETLGSTESFTNEVTSSNLWDKIAFLNPVGNETLLTPEAELTQDKFLIVNLDMAGFYRVNYDVEDWRLISQQLEEFTDQLSPRTRAQLVSDALSLSEGNQLNGKIAFKLISYLHNELDYLPWTTFISRIKFFIDLFDSTSIFGKLQNFMSQLVTPYYTKLGWIEDVETDTFRDRFTRATIIRFACLRDVPDCLSTARDFYNDWKADDDINKLPRGLRSVISCAVVNSGNQEDFDFIFNKTKEILDISARNDLLSGLSCSKEQWLLTRYLDDQLSNPNNILTALNNVASKPYGNLLAWSYLKNNWVEIYSRFSNSGAFSTLLRELTNRFKYQEQYNDFASFFTNRQLNRGLQNTVNEVKLKMKSNIKWYQENNKDIIDWIGDLKF